jgi:carbon-monoxide dehydrogenase medium subunit
MYPAQFEYHKATSVQEAVSLLGKLGDDAKLLAGGHSLIPAMKLRLAQPKHLIDIGKIPGLSGIREQGDAIVIGGTTTHWTVESSTLLKQKCPILSETAALIGDPQVRNMGTLGGSLAHADPAADYPAVVLALGVELKAVGPKGERTIKIDDFFKDVMTTALGAGEVLTEIRVPAPATGTVGAYKKFPHPASRFAVVGVAAVLTLDAKGVCQKASIAITGAGPKATRAKGVEAALQGKALDAATIQAASEKAADGIDVQADLQGSVEYKRHITKVYTRRAIEAAQARAKK